MVKEYYTPWSHDRFILLDLEVLKMAIEKTTGAGLGHIEQIKENQNLRKSGTIKGVSDATKGHNHLHGFDSVEISNEVRELQKTLAHLKSEIKNVPDIRKEKIEDVRANIKNGFYDKPETIAQVASSMREAVLWPSEN